MTFIFHASYVVAPFQNCLEHGSLSDRVVGRIALDYHMVVEIFGYVLFKCLETYAVAPVHDLLQELVWVCGVQFEAFFDELFSQAVVNI